VMLQIVVEVAGTVCDVAGGSATTKLCIHGNVVDNYRRPYCIRQCGFGFVTTKSRRRPKTLLYCNDSGAGLTKNRPLFGVDCYSQPTVATFCEK